VRSVAIQGGRTKTKETVPDTFLPPDNPTPHETTKQDALEMGPDGTGLSCPVSSEVADSQDD